VERAHGDPGALGPTGPGSHQPPAEKYLDGHSGIPLTVKYPTRCVRAAWLGLGKGTWAHNDPSAVGFFEGPVDGRRTKQAAAIGVTEGTRTPDLQGHNLAL
jgi:hypothetical protein